MDCLVCGATKIECTNYVNHHCVDLEREKIAEVEQIPIFVTCEFCLKQCYPAGLRAHKCTAAKYKTGAKPKAKAKAKR